MLSQTTTTTVVFERPFTPSAVGRVLPPGSYVIDTEEELIPGLSFKAYRSVSTAINLTIRAGSTIARQVVTIDPVELETVLKRDAALLRRDEVDQQAIDRAENEGTISQPKRSAILTIHGTKGTNHVS